jgi:glycerate 2-kinase
MGPPFPGMDPFLESPAYWRDFHQSFITYWRDWLLDHLPDHYEVRIDERLSVVEEGPGGRKDMLPDLSVSQAHPLHPVSEVATAVAHPPPAAGVRPGRVVRPAGTVRPGLPARPLLARPALCGRATGAPGAGQRRVGAPAAPGVAGKGEQVSEERSVVSNLRQHACAIWQAAVSAADPFEAVRGALVSPSPERGAALAGGGRVVVVGGGKAGASMAAGVEAGLAGSLARLTGVVNVPAGSEARALARIHLHPGRPAGSNHPTAEGVAGVERMLSLVSTVGPGDVGLCLLSGGGSALLPAPVPGVSLEDKQEVTRLLHACGATIGEMNCVRKHLSRIKGGRLAEAFAARRCPVFSLIISDVIGDPLDVIASGPTAADPTSFAQALAILGRYDLLKRVPRTARAYLERGQAALVPETPKGLPAGVHNRILGNNALSLAAAAALARRLGYTVLNLGSFIEGETRHAATVHAGIVKSVVRDQVPFPSPLCLLSGGETTVTLGDDHGQGGRNQEFVLAALLALGQEGMRGVVVLSGGTDGEDGPTDAAGAVADAGTLSRAAGLSAPDHLDRHDAYPFFAATGDLLRTGLTGTNVMDVRVLLIAAPSAG